LVVLAQGVDRYLRGRPKFNAGTNGNLLIETTGTDGYVIADAALWLPLTGTPPTSVDVIGTDILAGEDGPDVARFTIARTGDSSSEPTVTYVLSGTATPGLDYIQPAGSVVLPAGQNFVTVTITPLPDSLFEGDETVLLTLPPNPGYQLGVYTNASATLRDGGFSLWRGSHFTSAELSDPAISGETADPDQDRVVNLLEFFHGSSPKSADSVPRLRFVQDGSGWHVAWSRHQLAASLYVRMESSADLAQWAPAPFGMQTPQVITAPPFQILRFPSAAPAAGDPEPMFYRAAVSQRPMALLTNEAALFFSFDTQPDGQALFSINVTTNFGFLATPLIGRIATAIDNAGNGGATQFTDFTGTTWLVCA